MTHAPRYRRRAAGQYRRLFAERGRQGTDVPAPAGGSAPTPASRKCTRAREPGNRPAARSSASPSHNRRRGAVGHLGARQRDAGDHEELYALPDPINEESTQALHDRVRRAGCSTRRDEKRVPPGHAREMGLSAPRRVPAARGALTVLHRTGSRPASSRTKSLLHRAVITQRRVGRGQQLRRSQRASFRVRSLSADRPLALVGAVRRK